jgi:ADP-L-glycero-D-manno-heptose 6-epimerase
MASVSYHLFNQYLNTGKINLFSEYDNYLPGEQLRDFIYIEDVIDVNLFFLNHSKLSGIYNVGTGNPRTFNDVALSTINSILHFNNEKKYTIHQLINKRILNYVDFPIHLKGKYQSFTKADLTKLYSVGYNKQFTSLENGVNNYVSFLIKNFKIGKSDL